MVEFGLAVLPSAGVLFLFYLGVKALVEADRRERAAQARIEGKARQEAQSDQGESDQGESDQGRRDPGRPNQG